MSNVQFFGTLKSYEVSASGLGNPPRTFRVSENDLESFIRVLTQNDVAEINIKHTLHSHPLFEQPGIMPMQSDPTLTAEAEIQEDEPTLFWKAGVHQEPSPNQCNITGHGSDGEGQFPDSAGPRYERPEYRHQGLSDPMG